MSRECTVMPPNTSLPLTRLACGKGGVPGLSGCAIMGKPMAEPSDSIARGWLPPHHPPRPSVGGGCVLRRSSRQGSVDPVRQGADPL
jgi:hypothetical protein